MKAPIHLLRHALPLLLASLACVASADSLPEVMRRALMRHPDIRSGQAQLNVSSERLKQAQSNFYPTFGLDGAASDARDLDNGARRERTTRRADAFLRWNLFRGLGDRQGERMAEFDQSAAHYGLADVREQVALDVTLAYLDVLRMRRQMALEESYIAEHQRLGEEVRARVERGRIAQAELEQVRASLIQARLRQSQLRGQLLGAEARYRLLVGTQAGELDEPRFEDAVAGLELDELLGQVLAGNPRVQALRQGAAARGEEVGVAAAGLMPSFDFELRKRLVSEIDPIPQVDTRQSAQIQFNYQLPLGGAGFSRKREAAERKLAAQAEADAELLRASEEIVQRWSAWREARAIAADLAERVAASARVVKAHDLQFSAARRSVSDLIATRAEHHRAAGDLLDNRMEQLASAARVLNLLGRLRGSVLGACRTLVVDSENRPQRGHFLPDSPQHECSMVQEAGEKGAAAVDLQPTIPKSDRLPGGELKPDSRQP